MSIRREITVTRKGIMESIDIVYGTDLIPIELSVVDYAIPAEATAVAYTIGSREELRKEICSINENEISFTPRKGFFDEGLNVLQIRVTYNDKDLICFEHSVQCQHTVVSDDVKEVESNPTIVQQMLSELGVLSARLDEALKIPEGGTTGDVALNDIKIGYDGTVYDTPGEAVREQTKNAMERVDSVYKATAIIRTVSGETIVTTDSANVPPLELDIYGGSTQRTTEGNQLLPYPYNDTTMTTGGITFTDNGDGSITLNGTAGELDVYFNFALNDEAFTLPANTYTIFAEGIVDGVHYVSSRGVEDEFFTNGSTFTFEEETEFQSWLQILSGTTVNTTIYPMLNVGTEKKPWEPFTGGEASPNMEYKQPIVSMGQMLASGNQLLNLPDLEETEINGVKISCKNGIVSIKGTSTDIVNTSLKGLNQDNIPLTIGTYYISGSACNIDVYAWVIAQDGSNFWYNNNSFELDGTEQAVNCYINMSSGVTVDTVIYPMLNVGSEKKKFEPYTSDGVKVVDVGFRQEILRGNLLPFLVEGASYVKGNLQLDVYKDKCVINGTPSNAYDNVIYVKVNLPQGTYYMNGGTLAAGNMYLQISIKKDGQNFLYLPYKDKNTFTISGDERNITATIQVGNNWEGVEFKDYVIYPTLGYEREVDYEPYTEQTLTFPYVLRGIPVDSDGNCVDSTGQRYIADYVDCERGKLVRHIYEETFTDFSSIIDAVYEPSEGYTEGCITIDTMLAESGHGFCDKFILKSVGQELRFAFYHKTVYFTIEGELSRDEWIARMNEIAPTVHLIRETPIEIDLTDEEIAAYKAITMNYPTTTIMGEGHKVVKYVADTGKHIEQNYAPKSEIEEMKSQIAELQALIVNNA